MGFSKSLEELHQRKQLAVPRRLLLMVRYLLSVST